MKQILKILILLSLISCGQLKKEYEKRYISKSGENVFCRITTFFVDNPENHHRIHRVTQIENRTDVVVLKEKLTRFRKELAKRDS